MASPSATKPMASPAPKLSGLAMKTVVVPEGLAELSKEELISLIQGLSTEREDLQGACRALARQQSSDVPSPRAPAPKVATKKRDRGPKPGPCAFLWGEGATKTEATAATETGTR